LRPRLGVPPGIRLAFLAPAATAFVTFATIGFYAALIPGLLAGSMHQPSPVVSGLVVFELFAVATIAGSATGRLPSRTAMLAGLSLLLPSRALLVTAELAQSLPV